MSDSSEDIKKLEELYHKLQALMSEFSVEDMKRFLESLNATTSGADEQKDAVLNGFRDISASLNKLAEFIERRYKI